MDPISLEGHGGDDDDDVKQPQEDGKGGPAAGDYNLGEEIGERIGEGHDPVEDPFSS
ncbi:MAG: hypothetical protein AAB489_01835 [Patescibacteria group bacterium]